MKIQVRNSEDRESVGRTGTFQVQLVSARQRNYRDDAVLPAHAKVLRPLLAVATECWVYGIKPRTDVFRAARGLLEADKGKHRVHLEGDPISGHELFWNADSGRRGTIVILVPRSQFDAARLLGGGYRIDFMANFLSAHTPAAIRFARERVAASDLVAACLPRNNGIEWMDIFAQPTHAKELYDVAMRLCGRK